MNYWQGMMNWPTEAGWKCETCGQSPIGVVGIGLISTGLEWGLVHGECRCTQCHTIYNMRVNDVIQTIPVSGVRDSYKNAARWAWNEWRIPIDELSDEQWNEALEPIVTHDTTN